MKLLQKAIRTLKRQPTTKVRKVELQMPNSQPNHWAIRQWSNVTKRKLPADWRSKFPEVELRMPNNPKPQLPDDWRSAEAELRMPMPNNPKLQTDVMNYRNENVVPGKNLINSVEMNRVARAVDNKMQQRTLWQKITDGITPGSEEARLRGFYNDYSIPEVNNMRRSINSVNKTVNEFNNKAKGAFVDFSAILEPRVSYEKLINDRLIRK